MNAVDYWLLWFNLHVIFNLKEIEHVRVATSVANKPLVEYYFEDVRTLHSVLAKGLALSG